MRWSINSGSKATPIAMIALALVSVILFYHPLTDPTTMPSGGDAANLFWPMKQLIERSLWQDSVIPLWNPWSFMGSPLAASLQHSIYYPLDRLLYGLLPAHSAIHYGNLVHLLITAGGMIFFLRKALRLSLSVACVFGALFPCCAWFWGHQEHINQLATAAWLPWMAAFSWMLVKERMSIQAFILAYSSVGAIQFLAGHPQEAYYTHLLCFLILLGGWVTQKFTKAAALRLFAPFAIAGIFLGGLVSIQLLPAMELSSHSRRQIEDPTYPFFASMPPDVLITALNPHYFGSYQFGYFVRDQEGNLLGDEAGNPAIDWRAYGEYGIYTGLPVLLLLLLSLFFARREKRTWFFLALLLITLLLAMGGNTDPRRILAWEFSENPGPGYSLYDAFLLLPGADSFRVPSRILLLTTFAMITMAALALNQILLLIKRNHGGLLVPFFGVLAIVALYLPSRNEKFHDPQPVEAVLSANELTHTTREQRAISDRLYRLTLSDDNRLMRERQRSTMPEKNRSLSDRFHANQPHMNVIGEVPLIDGYEEGLVPTLRFHDFLWEVNRNLRTGSPDPVLLSLLGAGLIYSDLPVNSEVYRKALEIQGDLGAVYTGPMSGSAAFMESDYPTVLWERLDGTFWRLGEPRSSFNREPIVYTDGPVHSLPRRRLESAVVTVNTMRVGGIAPRAEMVLLSMGWFPGWVDAAGEPMVWRNAIHAEVGVPEEGPFIAEVSYRPFSFRFGLYLSAFFLMIWVVLLRWWLYASSRRSEIGTL